VLDTRGTPTVHAGASHFAFGVSAQSASLRKLDFKAAERMPEFPKLNAKAAKFAKQYGLDMSPKIWNITPGPAKQKKVLYMGTAPAGLFRSADGGNTWDAVDGINAHKTRKDWSPGAGGQCLHSIELDPHDANRMWVAISAAGSFRTDDGGATWKPINACVASYVGAPEQSEVSTCVHKLLVHPNAPGVLFQQNHVGVYRSTDYGDLWERIDNGLPYDFGFGLALNAQDPHACYVIPLEPGDYSFRATNGALDVYEFGRRGKWTKRSKGLPRKHAHVSVLRQAMTSDTLDPCGVYFGTQGGAVFASNDAGRSWDKAVEHLPPIYSVTAAIVE
jgi:photosystem II stability/assembly factor-like uncharacterized protein